MGRAWPSGRSPPDRSRPVGRGRRRPPRPRAPPCLRRVGVRVLILGGGFGGVYTALTLEKLLKRELREGRVELGLVSRDNYIVFQPMLPEVISGSIGILDTITPIRRLCPSTNLYTRTVDKIEIGRATSELQSLAYLVCRLLLEKKKKIIHYE